MGISSPRQRGKKREPHFMCHFSEKMHKIPSTSTVLHHHHTYPMPPKLLRVTQIAILVALMNTA